MKVRMVITTPPGQAEGSEKRLRTFLLGFKRPSATGYRDDSFYWEVETDYKGYVGLTKKAYMFNQLAGGVVSNKAFKGAAERLGATKAQLREVEDMLLNGTRLEIIKTATAEEIVEGTTTWWEKFKARFRTA